MPGVNVRGPCRLWTGALDSDGYGLRKVAGRVVRVYRLAYEEVHGPIPEGLTIDHLCRVHACYAVRHLEAVTRQVNILRGEGITARRARQTACIHGHDFTPENTYRQSTGGRGCKTCRRVVSREAQRRRRAMRRAA